MSKVGRGSGKGEAVLLVWTSCSGKNDARKGTLPRLCASWQCARGPPAAPPPPPMTALTDEVFCHLQSLDCAEWVSHTQYIHMYIWQRIKHMAANQNIGLVTGLGGHFATKVCIRRGCSATNPSATSPLKTTVFYTEIRDKGL